MEQDINDKWSVWSNAKTREYEQEISGYFNVLRILMDINIKVKENTVRIAGFLTNIRTEYL